MNNFQARYAIRHPWTGPITCKEPRRGIWGGPPVKDVAQTSAPPPKPARDLAFVKRGADLASFIKSDVPELGVRSDPTASPPISGVGQDKKVSRCGCALPGADASVGGLAAGAIAAVLAFVRRKRRATARGRARG